MAIGSDMTALIAITSAMNPGTAQSSHPFPPNCSAGVLPKIAPRMIRIIGSSARVKKAAIGKRK